MVSSDFRHTQLSFFAIFLRPVVKQFSKNGLFRKNMSKLLFFSNFPVLSSDFESIFLTLQKHYKNMGFKGFLCFWRKKGKK